MNGLFIAIFSSEVPFFSVSVFFLIAITIYQFVSTKTAFALLLPNVDYGGQVISSQLNTHRSSSPIAPLTSATINVNITSEMRTVTASEGGPAEHINWDQFREDPPPFSRVTLSLYGPSALSRANTCFLWSQHSGYVHVFALAVSSSLVKQSILTKTEKRLKRYQQPT